MNERNPNAFFLGLKMFNPRLTSQRVGVEKRVEGEGHGWGDRFNSPLHYFFTGVLRRHPVKGCRVVSPSGSESLVQCFFGNFLLERH